MLKKDEAIEVEAWSSECISASQKPCLTRLILIDGTW